MICKQPDRCDRLLRHDRLSIKYHQLGQNLRILAGPGEFARVDSRK